MTISKRVDGLDVNIARNVEYDNINLTSEDKDAWAMKEEKRLRAILSF